MESKRSNLCLSIDVTSKSELLRIADAVGPYVCLIKTHIDIVEDFDLDVISQLQRLSKKHDFLIFEDRKFADIGNTAMLQYSGGIYKISSWAHLINAHPVAGPGIIAGLSSVGVARGRGLLLMAEMSSEGNLATGEYTKAAFNMASDHQDFVIGFIAMKRGDWASDFLTLTPGVSLETSKGTYGQQYKTAREVIYECQSDVIIVGRAIYGGQTPDEEVVRRAQTFQQQGWSAYEMRLKK